MSVLLKMEKINKLFPGVRALTDVDFEVNKGEVHALIGENGAGKSTLMKCLTGVYKADSGSTVECEQPEGSYGQGHQHCASGIQLDAGADGQRKHLYRQRAAETERPPHRR